MQLRCLSSPELRWYHSGGLFGAFYVTSSALCIPYTGFSLFYVCLVTGQLLAAVLIDRFGLLGNPRLQINVQRIVGCALTLLGAILVFQAHTNEGSQDSNDGVLTFICVMCAFLSGTFLPIQAAVNNVLKRKEGLTTTATVGVSLLVGAIALSVVSALTYAWISPALHASQDTWWHWTGGVFGVLFLFAGTKISPMIGYSTFFISVISGQLVLSLLSDVFGLLGPVKPGASGPLSLSGVLLAALGAGVVSVYKSQPPPLSAGEVEEGGARVMDGGGGDDGDLLHHQNIVIVALGAENDRIENETNLDYEIVGDSQNPMIHQLVLAGTSH
jgi:bacterial/archaeal transporter family-2 protein